MYFELMIEQWDTGPLPNNIGQLADRIGAKASDLQRSWGVIGACFTVQADGTLINEPLERHRLRMMERRQRASDDGKAAAGKRWGIDRVGIGNPFRPAKDGHTTWDNVAVASASAIASAVAVGSESTDHDALAERAGNLIRRYQELYAKHRNGARLHTKPALDFERACDLCRTWPDDDRLDKMAAILLTTDDDWVAKTDRGFGVFASRATWADERLSAWEAKNGVAAV